MGFGAVNVDLNPGGILKAIFDGIDALTTSDEEKMALKNEALKQSQQGDLQAWGIQAGLLQAQIAVNQAEAGSGNFFAAGWRPSIGWTCSIALLFQFVVSPIGQWVFALLGHPVPAPPNLDDMLWELMFGMLGIGALRSYDKLKGTSK